ncbi:NACHT domain-containing protein [Lentzea jiangxiensis]|uniref:NACHT domain-containing protein n=1 Tax=Lentzea jiangxiensis TaxID=641025 RepID=A0A1H0WPG3_9PSEU|nr:NACHT domain-containing protein [Lentzea jiangxiensis]SDP92527.1 NACHT domain-containing protein [Lentzea jiangxiensis]
MHRPKVVATVAFAAPFAIAILINLATETVDLPSWSAPVVWGSLASLILLAHRLPAPPAPAPAAGASARDLLNENTDRLAESVKTQWRDEEERRRLHHPGPLALRWTNADETLIDRWSNIRRLASGENGGPLDLAGKISEVGTVHRRIPSGRLVVLGGAGSGKSVLALRLVLALLEQRRRSDPVPVMFTVTSWIPGATTFREWLVRQLVRDHPWLGQPGAGGRSVAADLVDRRKILPVLDGFDEMAPSLQVEAVKVLNRNRMALVVICRLDQFRAVVRSAGVLAEAAAIEIADLELSDVADYLPRTTAARRTPPGDGTDWDTVLDALRDHPEDDAAATLTTVLSSPLMVELARTVYSDAPRANPKELLDSEAFPTPGAVERHLLDEFLPAAYRQPPVARPADAPSGKRYTAAEAKKWLTHLTRSRDHEIAWWRMGRRVHPATATTLYAAIFATVFGAFFRLDAALYLTTCCTLLSAFSTVRSPLPVQASLQFREFVVALGQEAVKGLRGRLSEGLLFGGLVGTGFGVVLGLTTVAGGLLLGVACWLAGTLLYMVVALRSRVFTRFVNHHAAPCPVQMIADDRRCAIVRSAVLGLATGIPTLGLFDLARAAEMAMAVAVTYALSGTAWGRWLVIVRFWLPLTGRLPWKLHAFLDDACERAVLRQTGAIYEFRHIALRTNLIAHDRGHRPVPNASAPPRREEPPPAS